MSKKRKNNEKVVPSISSDKPKGEKRVRDKPVSFNEVKKASNFSLTPTTKHHLREVSQLSGYSISHFLDSVFHGDPRAIEILTNFISQLKQPDESTDDSSPERL